MKIAKIIDVPPVLQRDLRLLQQKGQELFVKEYQELGNPRLTSETTLDIMELVIKKLRLWTNTKDYQEALKKQPLDYKG